jgi:hypothetical protein
LGDGPFEPPPPGLELLAEVEQHLRHFSLTDQAFFCTLSGIRRLGSGSSAG